MKFLLTSSGLTNQSITNALLELVGKKAQHIAVAFIPTAANVEKGDKGWLISDLYNLKKEKFKCIDIVDISALPRAIWEPRLQAADVLFFFRREYVSSDVLAKEIRPCGYSAPLT